MTLCFYSDDYSNDWFLTNIRLLFLAGDVVPLALLIDPDAVLVVVVVVWLSNSPGCEAHIRAVNPLLPVLHIQEVCQTNPSPFRSRETIDSVLFLL